MRPRFSNRRTPAPASMLDRQAGFGFGLLLGVDDFSLPENAVRRAENVDLSDDGLARKRRGLRRTSVAPLAASPVQGGVGWARTGLGALQVVLVNGALYTTTLAASGSASAWTARAGAFSATALPHFAAFTDGTQDTLYVADGGPLNKYTGGASASVDLAGTPASVDGIVVYNQRLIGWHGNTVYWSALGNGDSLGNVATGGGSAVVQSFGEREIVGAGVLGGTLYLLHRVGISTFTGTANDDITIQANTQGLTQDVGCVARLSVVATDSALYWMSDRGVYTLDVGGVRPLSVPIDPVCQALAATAWPTVLAVHARARRQIRVWLPGVGVYALAYRANQGQGAWSGPWTGGYLAPGTTALWETEDSTGAPAVLRGTSAGHVEQCDVVVGGQLVRDALTPTNTGGQPIGMALGFRRLTHGDLGTAKSYRFGRVTADLAGSTSAALAVATGSGSGQAAITPASSTAWDASTWDGGTWDDGLGLVPYRVAVEGTGPYADCTLVDGSDREVIVAAGELEAFPAGRRQFA